MQCTWDDTIAQPQKFTLIITIHHRTTSATRYNPRHLDNLSTKNLPAHKPYRIEVVQTTANCSTSWFSIGYASSISHLKIKIPSWHQTHIQRLLNHHDAQLEREITYFKCFSSDRSVTSCRKLGSLMLLQIKSSSCRQLPPTLDTLNKMQQIHPNSSGN